MQASPKTQSQLACFCLLSACSHVPHPHIISITSGFWDHHTPTTTHHPVVCRVSCLDPSRSAKKKILELLFMVILILFKFNFHISLKIHIIIQKLINIYSLYINTHVLEMLKTFLPAGCIPK